MPTFTKIEDVKRYGLPVEIDGIALTRQQACDVLPIIVGRIMDEAGHDLKTARDLAVGTFKVMYEAVGDRWVAKKVIHLNKGHGRPFRNRFHSEEDERMPRGKAIDDGKTPARRLRESLQEGGARNSKRDKAAIKEVVKHSLSQLSKDDIAQTLKDLGFKLKEQS
jgi:hypothetical protein